jgi:hypothetical protein
VTRPENVVKAEALRETAQELWRIFLRLPHTPSPLGDYIQRRMIELRDRADRLATDTAAPVAVEGVETVEPVFDLIHQKAQEIVEFHLVTHGVTLTDDDKDAIELGMSSGIHAAIEHFMPTATKEAPDA